jgi:hypothetical protein
MDTFLGMNEALIDLYQAPNYTTKACSLGVGTCLGLTSPLACLSPGGQNDDFRPLTFTLGGAWGAGTNM